MKKFVGICRKFNILIVCHWLKNHKEIYVRRTDFKVQTIYNYLAAGYAYPGRGKPPPVRPAGTGYYRCVLCGKTNGETEQQWREKILKS